MSPREGRIVFENVWKRFRRGSVHDSLRELIPATLARVLGRAPRPEGDLQPGDFWAVRDLSFDVQPGQCLGIVGPNGSGKSTTLKLLTRIYAPTRGRTLLVGRVGALIEISAGFHGDLTGRENVFLQGAMMGMRIREVRQKFDEIVAFSGVSDFIDTPVKRYSSGMNARLGFAIAAHLEPDVLVIDEVLSVGDLSFQQKAFNRIRDMTRRGIPVAMVSHQLERVAEMCTSVIVLRRGEVVAQGDPTEAITAYVSEQRLAPTSVGGGPVRFAPPAPQADLPVASGEMFIVRVSGEVLEAIEDRVEPLHLRVRSLRSGAVLYSCDATTLGARPSAVGPFAVDIEIQANVPAGRYVLEIVALDHVRAQELAAAEPVMFRVTEPIPFAGSVQFNPVVRLLDGVPAVPPPRG